MGEEILGFYLYVAETTEAQNRASGSGTSEGENPADDNP